MTDQPDFLNACLRIRTELGPEELLDVCKEVERELGREPGGMRHGPRPIDVDVLLLDDVVHRSERLTLPHAEVATRRFVLEPLLELDPELRLPDGTPLRELLPAVMDQRVTPHAGVSWRLELRRGPTGGALTWWRSWRASAATTIPLSWRPLSPAAAASLARSTGRS